MKMKLKGIETGWTGKKWFINLKIKYTRSEV